jgi:hypothetical protein
MQHVYMYVCMYVSFSLHNGVTIVNVQYIFYFSHLLMIALIFNGSIIII